MHQEAASNPPRRGLVKGTLTYGLFTGCFFAYPLLICGCHFHTAAAFVTFLPFIWSLMLLMTYKSVRGQIGAWISFLLAVFWVWIGIESNIRFLLR